MSIPKIINQVDTKHKAIAITFDDGPNPVYTPQVLDLFREVSGKATFFMIGEQMKKYPDIVSTVSKEGHEIGNHTYTHSKLTTLTPEDCQKEVQLTEQLIRDMTGTRPVTFRPPYLDLDHETSALIHSRSYSIIGALNMEALDWEQPGVDHILSKSRKHAMNGSVLLFHDGFGNRSQTVEAVRMLVAELSSKGYRLVTVSELLELRAAT
ncbi:polysaccharide deacetylase family protein [Mesobacillus foraminis]|uniref:polysaccharide deacetylase family protein n=1 Tax=Mesobacillus foraminis TaxID=279826 RepID=UPI000EF44B30|nr:polysaccharide deacetylase family protein [Mesobacillus foraminis]